MQKIIYSLIALSLSILPISLFSDEEEVDRGGIEEITVTAEKRTSTVSDTSMSITAFDSSLIEDLGMQGANDLMDQLPATTRDAYDVRIRGVGRNFRALGGDPGVATYYNGIIPLTSVLPLVKAIFTMLSVSMFFVGLKGLYMVVTQLVEPSTTLRRSQLLKQKVK